MKPEEYHQASASLKRMLDSDMPEIEDDGTSPSGSDQRLVRPDESPHRCNTMLCGALAAWRRPRIDYKGEQYGWQNCCHICYIRNQHNRSRGWVAIIQPNDQGEALPPAERL